MARRRRHAEHQNHEAWAIPYGDLITLLLAFFVVMYSMSSINEGKYRILSDSLVAAFRGTPMTPTPVQISPAERGQGSQAEVSGLDRSRLMTRRDRDPPVIAQKPDQPPPDPAALARMAGEVRLALQGLIDSGGVRVRETQLWLEIEINADILFPSGVAQAMPEALPILDRLATILAPFPNAIRVEGHTDDRPINTAVFPSNWELSAARAGHVVQRFTRAGVNPLHMEIIGLGEYHPVADNATVAGRDRNRRVTIVVLQERGSVTGRRRQDPESVADPGPPAG
jgi:chemotaxis protein MotB